MLQRQALDGSYLTPAIDISEFVKRVQPYVTFPEQFPRGLIDLDLKTGMATVIVREDKKPVLMRYGKLLNKIGLPKDEVLLNSTLIASLKTHYNTELKFTKSSEEVVSVYSRGPKSCMRKSQAVRVYATEDVAVAYLENGQNIIARAVVCINEDIGLQYSKPYGFVEPLELKLKEQGFVEGDLEGCKLLRIEEDDQIVMPYLDGVDRVTDNSDFMVIDSDGEFSASNETGYVGYSECDCCGTHISDGESCYSEHRDESLCESCYDEQHVYINGDTYHKESDKIQKLEDGDYVLAEDACYVDYRCGYHERDNCVYNSYLEEYILRSDIE